jgi:hypothetical protein
MSDELRLPEDLAACEARLAAMSLPASRIDRDELMYRAGWAAALAGVGTTRLAVADPPPSKRGILAASLASAALAASLAVAITLQWRPAAEHTLIVAQEPKKTTEVHAAAAPRPTARRTAPVRPGFSSDVDALLARFSGRNGLRAESPLAARLHPGLDEEGALSAIHADAAASPAATKTARQLLEELLPESRARDISLTPTRLWPWSGLNSGESI